jgi:hypothetical protein
VPDAVAHWLLGRRRIGLPIFGIDVSFIRTTTRSRPSYASKRRKLLEYLASYGSPDGLAIPCAEPTNNATVDDGEFFLPTPGLTSTRANSTPHLVSNNTGLPELAEVPDLSKSSPSSSKQTHILDFTQFSNSLLEQLANTPDLSETLKVLPEQTDAFSDSLLEQLANAADDIQTSDPPSLAQSADATATATQAELQDRAVRLLPIRDQLYSIRTITPASLSTNPRFYSTLRKAPVVSSPH